MFFPHGTSDQESGNFKVVAETYSNTFTLTDKAAIKMVNGHKGSYAHTQQSDERAQKH